MKIETLNEGISYLTGENVAIKKPQDVSHFTVTKPRLMEHRFDKVK